MIPAISFVGHHNSGKTHLICRLIPYLAERGFRVGAVKHAPHAVTPASQATDSATLGAAGAEPVLLLGPSEAVLTWTLTKEEPLSVLIDKLFAGCDIVLVEGFKRGPLPKIEVFRRGRDIAREPLAGTIDVLAVVTDDRIAMPDEAIMLRPSDLSGISDLIESTLF